MAGIVNKEYAKNVLDDIRRELVENQGEIDNMYLQHLVEIYLYFFTAEADARRAFEDYFVHYRQQLRELRPNDDPYQRVLNELNSTMEYHNFQAGGDFSLSDEEQEEMTELLVELPGKMEPVKASVASVPAKDIHQLLASLPTSVTSKVETEASGGKRRHRKKKKSQKKRKKCKRQRNVKIKSATKKRKRKRKQKK